MKKIESLLNEYGESHQTQLNRTVHYICVPAIFFSLVGLIASIPHGGLLDNLSSSVIGPYAHWGTILLVPALLYYLRLSILFFLGMLIFSFLVLLGIQWISTLDIAPLWMVMLGIFVVAWIGQFYGHKHEGKKPSFFKDIQFLLIGPAWTMSHLFDALKIKY